MNFFFSIRIFKPLILQTIKYLNFKLAEKQNKKNLQRKILVHVCKSQKIIIIFLSLQSLLCSFLSMIWYSPAQTKIDFFKSLPPISLRPMSLRRGASDSRARSSIA